MAARTLMVAKSSNLSGFTEDKIQSCYLSLHNAFLLTQLITKKHYHTQYITVGLEHIWRPLMKDIFLKWNSNGLWIYLSCDRKTYLEQLSIVALTIRTTKLLLKTDPYGLLETG